MKNADRPLIPDSDPLHLVQTLAMQLIEHQWQCAVAESCTGGLLAAAMTACPGSSEWFDGGVVTYSNQAKQSILGVKQETLKKHGAVSDATAQQMVLGVRSLTQTDVAMAITGIAGPGGGTDQKPVGTVWIAWSIQDSPVQTTCFLFKGSREDVRRQAVQHALLGLISLIKTHNDKSSQKQSPH